MDGYNSFSILNHGVTARVCRPYRVSVDRSRPEPTNIKLGLRLEISPIPNTEWLSCYGKKKNVLAGCRDNQGMYGTLFFIKPSDIRAYTFGEGRCYYCGWGGARIEQFSGRENIKFALRCITWPLLNINDRVAILNSLTML